MRGRFFASAPAAALVFLTGAALAATGQSAAPRKATPRPTPTPAVQQRQPQKVSTRPEEGKGTEEVPASVRAVLRSNGYRLADTHRQFVLPIALHKKLNSAPATRRIEGALHRAGLNALLGSPVTVVAERCGS